ncbi:Hsp70 family protein [Micromonospora sp. NPDC003816]|uniref:Hsp70 family protein n=1 Tax=Micromonospora sp. NPDC003816 TaxID=3364224 RepID=UPI00367E904F
MPSGLVYGVDFGMSTSALVIGRPGGEPVLARDPAGRPDVPTVPSAVCLLPDGTLAVGAVAEHAGRLRPQHYRCRFKRDFADPIPWALGEDCELTTHELTAEVLRFLREQATETVAGTPERVVVTVPASWEDHNRHLMRTAAGVAGFDPATVRLEPDPVAAAAYAFADTTLPAQVTALVYDLGGGTFDCAVAQTGPDGAFEVLGRPGAIPDLGGTDIDRMLLAHIRQRFPDRCAHLFADTTDLDLLPRRLQLRDTCEQIKIRLSTVTTHSADLTDLDPPTTFTFTRDELDELVRPALRETITECERLLDDLGLRWSDIDRIVPVGGPTRMPSVGRTLSGHTGRPVLRTAEPELAVAYGAALLAARPTPDTRRSARRAFSARPGPGQATMPAAAPTTATPDGGRRPDGGGTPSGVDQHGRTDPRTIAVGRRVYAVAVDGAGATLATGSPGEVQLWDLRHDRLRWRRRLGPGDDAASGVCCTPDGARIAAAGRDGTARVWDAVTGDQLLRVRHDDWVDAVTFSPDGTLLATASHDQTAVLWDSRSGRRLATFAGSHRLHGVAFHPDGSLLATAAGRRGAEVWSVAERRPLRLLPHDDWVNAVTFSPDGTLLATAGYDGTAVVWDTASGDRVVSVRHDGGVLAVAFGSRGRLLGTAGDDRTGRVWTVPEGREVSRIHHAGVVHGVAFAGPRTLVTGGHDLVVRISTWSDAGQEGR